MKTSFKYGLGLILASSLLASCEVDEDPTTQDYQAEYIGTWDCNEKTGINSPQFYEVNISAGTNSNSIIINNLYQNGTAVEATISGGFSLDITNQVSENISFVGSGSANANFGQITLNFTADDGSASPDVIEAILVK